MWSLIVFTLATSGATSATVTTLEFSQRASSADGTYHF